MGKPVHIDGVSDDDAEEHRIAVEYLLMSHNPIEIQQDAQPDVELDVHEYPWARKDEYQNQPFGQARKSRDVRSGEAQIHRDSSSSCISGLH